MSPPASDLKTAAPSLVAHGLGTPEGMRVSHQGRASRGAVIVEAKEALGSLLAGEQVHIQNPVFGTYTDVADAADALLKLGIDLTEPSRRWAFSVSGASGTEFVAEARGRSHTAASRVVVTVHHVIRQPDVYTVERARPKDRR